MRTMTGPRALAAFALALTALLAGACSSDQGGDKAGGQDTPIVLQMANASGELDSEPVIKDFVDRVGEISDGAVRIETVDQWGDFASDAEQQVVRGVSAGKADLGWVGARVFDTMGFNSFQALSAPQLVDSYALQDAVIESGITDEMMSGLDDLGVVGIGVLADGVRRPIGVAGPIVGPADWRGIGFGTFRSTGQADAIRALGARPAQVFGPQREDALKNGTIQGFELNISRYQALVLPHLAPYVTLNVTLWPQMDVLIGNPERLEGLTDEQRGWLEEAARGAADGSAALADNDAESLGKACESGARFAEASSADLAALRARFAPVYAELRRGPDTRAFIERIQALKQSTHDEPALSIPAGCAGRAPEEPSAAQAPAPADLNGTYRYVLTEEDARKAGDTEDIYPQVSTFTLEDGHWENPGGISGTYSVKGNRITFDVPEFGYGLTFTFSVDGEGDLHLTPVLPMDSGDQFQWATRAWTKID